MSKKTEEVIKSKHTTYIERRKRLPTKKMKEIKMSETKMTHLKQVKDGEDSLDALEK